MAAGDDPRSYAMLLSEVYDATMAGHRSPARPRGVIADSWNRLLNKGIDPDHHHPPDVDSSGLDALRHASGLFAVLDDVSRGLDSVIDGGDNILVVADARGRVLWRYGSPRVLTNADRLGFVEGAQWSESAVGTNAIGTALASHRAVQVFSAEHFLRSHHAWTCAGAPIKDPARVRWSASSTSRAPRRRCTRRRWRSSTSSPASQSRSCARCTTGR